MAKKKKALIVGITSQDGSYMAELLLKKGYEVIGTLRRSSTDNKENIRHLLGKIKIEVANLVDYETLANVVRKYKPDEVYNFAAQSIPGDSWSHPFYTGEVTALGVVRVLEAIRNFSPKSKFYQASSREIFGNVKSNSINEKTPIDPNNPYGIAKAYAHLMVRCYRESYGFFACSGILFNHESPRRSLHFVTRKITAAAACIKNNVKNPPINELGDPLVDKNGKLHLGNLNAKRDWGYAKEYMESVYLMLQQKKPKDYVIGTNTSYSVKDACKIAFDYVGLDWKKHVVSDKRLLRPTEIKEAKADYSLAKKELGWEPKTSFKKLIELMVEEDLKKFK